MDSVTTYQVLQIPEAVIRVVERVLAEERHQNAPRSMNPTISPRNFKPAAGVPGTKRRDSIVCASSVAFG